jgi:hypothetical protein
MPGQSRDHGATCLLPGLCWRAGESKRDAGLRRMPQSRGARAIVTSNGTNAMDQADDPENQRKLDFHGVLRICVGTAAKSYFAGELLMLPVRLVSARQ